MMLNLRYCPQSWDTVNILENGLVRTCLCPGWTKNGPIGKINSGSKLIDIFNSQNAIEFRNSIIDQSFKYCQAHCTNLWNLTTINQLPEIEYKLPSNIHLHIDKNCNLRCKSCRDVNIYSPEINPRAKEILDMLTEEYQNHTQTVFIYGDGSGDMFTSAAYQQFLHNDSLPKCFKFSITTNGNLLTKNIDLIKKLHDNNQIDLIIVSFDSATKETYKEVRGGNFDLLLDGILMVKSLGITVSTQYVTQYKNYREILDYVKLCKSIGINHIGLQKITRWPHMDERWWTENQIDNNPNIDYTFLTNALNIIDADSQCAIDGGLKQLLFRSMG